MQHGDVVVAAAVGGHRPADGQHPGDDGGPLAGVPVGHHRAVGEAGDVGAPGVDGVQGARERDDLVEVADVVDGLLRRPAAAGPGVPGRPAADAVGEHRALAPDQRAPAHVALGDLRVLVQPVQRDEQRGGRAGAGGDEQAHRPLLAAEGEVHLGAQLHARRERLGQRAVGEPDDVPAVRGDADHRQGVLRRPRAARRRRGGAAQADRQAEQQRGDQGDDGGSGAGEGHRDTIGRRRASCSRTDRSVRSGHRRRPSASRPRATPSSCARASAASPTRTS